MTKETPENTTLTVEIPKEERNAMTTGGQISAIVPRDHVEAFRFAEAFLHAGMIPPSYGVDKQGKSVNSWEDQSRVDTTATKARLAIGIMKGMEIGLPPITALSTICVINNRPCLWGDGAVALVQQSGKCEFMKDWHEGDWSKGTYRSFFQIKRRDNAEPITASFGQEDAKAAGLLIKKGPWASGYGPRMCFNRARAWALRDGFSDVLMGIGIAEEVRDIPQEPVEAVKPDLSSLDDGPIVTQAERDVLLEKPEPEEHPWTDEENDWLAVIDELRPELAKCKTLATWATFQEDNDKAISSLSAAPDSIKAKWNIMVDAQKSTFNT